MSIEKQTKNEESGKRDAIAFLEHQMYHKMDVNTNVPSSIQSVASLSDVGAGGHVSTPASTKETESTKSCRQMLSILKTNILRILTGIGVVLYWRGCWYLLDSFSDDLSIHDNLWRSALQCFVIATAISVITALIWAFIPPSWLIFDESEKCKYTLLKKIFQYILIMLFGFTSVAFWRGVWVFADYIMFPDNFELSFIISITAGLCLLALLQSCSSVIAAPMVFASDKDIDFYANGLHKTATTFKRMYANFQ